MIVNIFTDNNLYDYVTRGWSEEKLISGKIKTLSSRTFTITGLQESSTILEIKRKIEDSEGMNFIIHFIKN